jgi:hypothetical protein
MAQRSYEMSAQQRAGLLAYWFACGQRLTVAEVAQRLEMSPHAAWCLLRNIAGSVPLVREGEYWHANKNAQEGASAPCALPVQSCGHV